MKIVDATKSVTELTAISTEVRSPTPAEPGLLEPVDWTRSGQPEKWLHGHLQVVAAAITVVAFGLRAYVASRSYLNPDEALHYLIINQPNIWQTYKASLTNAHPPLIYLVLYVWRFLGRSELMLRMPSVLAGTAACWLGFKWVRAAAGDTAGIVALLLLGFSPGLVSLSAELRAYALLLASMTGALYFLTRAFEEKSARPMWIFSAFLYLSILSHYSAVFFTIAAGLYALARFADSRLPRNVVAAWAAGQAGALALYGFLYVTHISKIKSSIAVWSAGFGTAYFHPADGNIFAFTGSNTLNIFLFFFSQKIVAWTLLLGFIAGVGFLFRKEMLAGRALSPSEHLGILLLFPFLAVWGTALVGRYPYVGSRHTAFLAPFAIAGASYLLSLISRQRLWVGLVAATALMAFSQTAGKSMELNISSGDNSRQEMVDSIRYMHAAIPRGDIILVDYQSSLPIIFYFCGPKTIVPYNTFAGDYFEFPCSGDPIVALHTWKAAAPGFPKQFEDMAHSHGLKPGERVWFYQTGWGDTLDAKLDRQDSRFRCLTPRHFGTGITVIPFVVGPDFLPTTPSTSCPN
jgi:hypothetical protein